MRRRELYKEILRLAEPIYGSREASQIGRMILEESFGVGRRELILEPDIEVDCPPTLLRDVASGRPVQYIIGEAEFCDMRFVVREGVLIPRPESEELVRWICEECSCEEGATLDVGCGSGAIAVALSRALRHHVTALDLSPEALAIARENIARLSPEVELIEGDALRGVEHYTSRQYNIIVSNPPYIPQSEEARMRCNVTHYEPHMALFVPDDDPLKFYRAIARSARVLLCEEGSLYFEIHEDFGDAVVEMLHNEGYGDVRLKLDINDKARMICARQK